MDYLKNHCWCSESNWGDHYDCQIIVGLNSYKEGYVEDWENLIEKKDYFSINEYENLKDSYSKLSIYPSNEELKEMSTLKINHLKPEVIQWLHDNVQDYEGNKGWCVGSDDYVMNDSNCSYDLFFQRRRDAMKFIKTWSKWKKPIRYTQYFNDVRKVLDLKTGKY